MPLLTYSTAFHAAAFFSSSRLGILRDQSVSTYTPTRSPTVAWLFRFPEGGKGAADRPLDAAFAEGLLGGRDGSSAAAEVALDDAV